MQNAPTPPQRPPSTPGSAGAYGAAHPLPILSSLGLPGTMHAANGAPLPPFIPEGGAPAMSSWYHGVIGPAPGGGPISHGHGPPSGRSTPSGRNSGGGGGRSSKGGWTAPGAHMLGGALYGDVDAEGDGAKSSAALHAAHAAQASSSAPPIGPPFVCAACKQTYSRLEYLRRHERRHADIRPFVCECGKGFSRSDVLGRHKKQCKAVVGEDGKEGDSPEDREQGGPPAKKQRRSGGGRKKKDQDSPTSGEPAGADHSQYTGPDNSPSSPSRDGQNMNIDPALSAISQAAIMDQELAASHQAGIFPPPPEFSGRNSFNHAVSLPFPFAPELSGAVASTSAAPNPVMTTSADVANVASIALAELAAAATATMFPSQNNAFGAASFLPGSNSDPSSRQGSNSWSPLRSGSGSGSASHSPPGKAADDANETTTSPEQALLRVVGGSQEVQAGILSMQQQAMLGAPTMSNESSLVPVSPGMSLNPTVSNTANAFPTNVFSQNNNSLEWILSPSIQQLMAWANAASANNTGMGADRSNFSYFQNVPGLSHSSSNTSISIPTLSEDIAVVSSMGLAGENPGELQGAFGPGVSAAVSSAAAAVASGTIPADDQDAHDFFNGQGGFLFGAAAAIADGVASESEPGLATALATLKRSAAHTSPQQQQQQHQQQQQARRSWCESLALDLQKAFTDPRNPFFIPQHLFRACYSIPHWDLPPLTRLSMLAFHSQKNLLKHFPFMHEPTFRIDTTPGCLAFATCMLGASETGRKWWAGEEAVPRPEMCHIVEELKTEGHTYDEEDGQVLVRDVVMDEKMDMLLRVFGVRCKSQLDRVAGVQCLSLMQWKELLDADPKRRARAALTQQKVTAYARKSGFFDPKAEWIERRVTYTPSQVLDTMLSEAAELCFSYSFLPTYLPGCPDEEKLWRRWCDWEGRRRTSFILFVVDTVAHLDTGATMITSSEDVLHIPLPTPDYIWRATTPEAWFSALGSYQGPTLDQALHQLLGPGSEDIPAAKDGPSITGLHGPFARLIMMLALLRGVLTLMDGRHNRVARPSPLLPYFGAPLAPDGGRSELRIFKHALARWRKAWDGDALCKNVGWVQRWDDASMFESADGMPADAAAAQSMFASRTSHGATPLCDDALPFYWLGHVLLDHVSRGKKLPQRPVGSTLAAGKENISNKTKAKYGSTAPVDLTATVPDFRVLLKLAKQYVSGGAEGNPVDWPAIPLELFSSSS